eukprot:7295491-Prymnesium_polylepis.2
MPHPSSGSPGVKAPSTPPSNVPMPSYTACPQYATPSTPCVRTAPAQRPHAARPASTADSMLGGLRPQRQPRQGDRVAREVECVLEQHRDRHRADAARHRRDRPRHLSAPRARAGTSAATTQRPTAARCAARKQRSCRQIKVGPRAHTRARMPVLGPCALARASLAASKSTSPTST